jgi:hypothetical protein
MLKGAETHAYFAHKKGAFNSFFFKLSHKKSPSFEEPLITRHSSSK